MKKLLLSLALIGSGLAATAVTAHHSFTATYDESKEEVIEGKIVQFLLRNPHSMLHVEAPGADGQTHRYAVEWAGVAGLNGDGITRTTLRVGDAVTVRGNPGRNKAEFRLRMLHIERPIDGWTWGGTFQ